MAHSGHYLLHCAAFIFLIINRSKGLERKCSFMVVEEMGWVQIMLHVHTFLMCQNKKVYNRFAFEPQLAHFQL